MDKTIYNLLIVLFVVFTLALTGYRAQVQRDSQERVKVAQYISRPHPLNFYGGAAKENP